MAMPSLIEPKTLLGLTCNVCGIGFAREADSDEPWPYAQGSDKPWLVACPACRAARIKSEVEAMDWPERI